MIARRRAAAARAMLVGIAALLLSFVFAALSDVPASAELRGARTIVLYSEGVEVVRADMRRAVPEAFIVLDPSDYRSALVAAGAPPPLAKALGKAQTRSALFAKARAAAEQVRADVAVLLIANDTRTARFTRILVLDPKTEEPLLDTAVTLSKSKAPSKADVDKIKAKVGPLLERLAEPPEAGPETAPTMTDEASTAVASSDAGVDDADAAAPDTTDAAADAAPSGPAVGAEFAIRSFPVGGLDNSITAVVIVPITRTFFIQPLLGGGYETPVANGETDLYSLVGGGTRLVPSDRWKLEAVFFYGSGSQYVKLYRGILGTSLTLSPMIRVGGTLSVARVLWSQNLGPRDSEAISGNASVDVNFRFGKVWVAPNGGYFLYDRGLANANGGLGVLSRGYAPYPIRGWGGAYLGYDTGRLSPYVGFRQWFYAADIGIGTSFGLGVRLKSGSDFIDARGGFFLSDGQGPQSHPQRDKVPVFNVEAGWEF